MGRRQQKDFAVLLEAEVSRRHSCVYPAQAYEVDINIPISQMRKSRFREMYLPKVTYPTNGRARTSPGAFVPMPRGLPPPSPTSLPISHLAAWAHCCLDTLPHTHLYPCCARAQQPWEVAFDSFFQRKQLTVREVK